MKKPSLAPFNKKAVEPKAAAAAAPAENGNGHGPTARGKGEIVSLTIRMQRDDWKRAHALALDEGDSLHTLLLRGMSCVFKAKGLPGIAGY